MSKVPLHIRWFASSPLLAPPESVAEMLVAEANGGNPLAVRWLAPAVDGGFSEEFQDELDRVVCKVGLPMVVVRTGTSRSPKKRFMIGHSQTKATDDELFALAVVRLIIDGYTDRVHRCALADCGRFFVGDPRSRWCSDSCGSKVRVRAKRSGMSTDRWLQTQSRKRK